MKLFGILLLIAVTILPAYAASNDENVKIINTNYIDGLIAKRNAALEGNYPIKRKCDDAREVQKLMEKFMDNDLDQYNIDRIISSRRFIINFCLGN